MKLARIMRCLAMATVLLTLGSTHVRAEEVPGFSLEAIAAVGSVTLDARLGTASGSTEHVINIDDCTAYAGQQVDVTFRLDVSLGDFYHTVVVGGPDASCTTSSLEPTDTEGCRELITNDTLSSSTFTVTVDLDDLSGGDCTTGASQTARLHLIAQYTDDATIIYVSTVEFLVDLQAPVAPILTSVSSGDGQLTLGWTDDDNSGDSVTYNVYWQEGSGLTNPSAFSTLGLTALSYDIAENVENSITYSVGISAVDGADNESTLSNTESAAPAPSTDFWEAYQLAGGTDTGGFCFVATAAYGSPMAGNLGPLRAFRDQVLMRSELGRSLVASYYRWGRFAAAFMADKPALRAVVRGLLVPLVWVASLFVLFGPIGGLAALASLIMVLVAIRRRLFRWILRSVPMEVRR